MDGPSNTDPGIAQRLAGTIALWMTVAIGFHFVFWVLLSIGSPHIGWSNFLSGLWRVTPFLPIILVAMAPPAILHLFAPRRLALWSKLFLLLSIVLPVGYFMMIRADYLRKTAEGVRMKGVVLWNALGYVDILGLYTSVVSLIFAALLSRTEMRTHGRIARVHLGATAVMVILYGAVLASAFAPLFAVLYRWK